MAFEFDRFTDTDTTFAARVTLRQRTGQIGFNAGAINRFNLREFRFAILYYDRSQRVVGLQMTNEEQKGVIEIKQSAANTYVRAKNFCDFYGIDCTTAHRFELRRDDDSGFLYFALDDEIESAEPESSNGKIESGLPRPDATNKAAPA